MPHVAIWLPTASARCAWGGATPFAKELAVKPVLVVGAGFAGAVHARELADAGYTVVIIDRRAWAGGNAHDFINEDGVLVHMYGPHLFHTNIDRVVSWLTRFSDFDTYRHRVRAMLQDGRFVPLPINMTTVSEIYGRNFASPDELDAFLKSVRVSMGEPRNAADYLYSQIGRLLTDTFFRPYTRKMWGHDLEDMHPSVVKRLQIRMDEQDLYFPNDRYQLLPRGGYTALFHGILDHPNITLSLGTAFSRDMESEFGQVFNSMPIDEYFEYSLGELPYRSIRFHTRREEGTPPSISVTNFTDDSPFTRETTWNTLPGNPAKSSARLCITKEEPCDYKDNGMERYYPVRVADNRHTVLYQRYKKLADQNPRMCFIGRCGTYQYLDMDQVINQSLQNVKAWLSKDPLTQMQVRSGENSL